MSKNRVELTKQGWAIVPVDREVSDGSREELQAQGATLLGLGEIERNYEALLTIKNSSGDMRVKLGTVLAGRIEEMRANGVTG